MLTVCKAAECETTPSQATAGERGQLHLMMRRTRTLLVLAALALGAPAALAQPMPFGAATPAAPTDARSTDARTTLANAESSKARLEAELAGLAERRTSAQEQLQGRARALYRLGRAGMLPVAGGFDAMLGHLARVGRLRRMVQSDMGAVRFLENRGQVLEVEVARATREVTAAQTQVTVDEARQQVVEAQRLQAVFAQDYMPRLPVAPIPIQAPSYGSIRVVDEPARGPTFSTLRGALPVPIVGPVQVREAVRDDGPGLEFLSAGGTQVRTVAAGRVAFSGRSGSYGRLVIIDHEQSFFTVYGGLGASHVRVGDWVGTGAIVGRVAAEVEPALFFEVRRGTRSLDARSWLGL